MLHDVIVRVQDDDNACMCCCAHALVLQLLCHFLLIVYVPTIWTRHTFVLQRDEYEYDEAGRRSGIASTSIRGQQRRATYTHAPPAKYDRRFHCQSFRMAINTFHDHHAADVLLQRTSRAAAPTSRVRCQAARTHVGSLVVDKGTKFAVVVARFNDLVTKLLLEGAVEALKRHGAAESDIEVVWVPGSFELPVVAKCMAQSGTFGAVITLGAVV